MAGFSIVLILLIEMPSSGANLGTTKAGKSPILTAFTIYFSDPEQPHGRSGNAFDRDPSFPEIGVNLFASNSVLVTANPGSVLSNIAYDVDIATTAAAGVIATVPPLQTVRLTGLAAGYTAFDAHLVSNSTKKIAAIPLGIYVFPQYTPTLSLHVISDSVGGGHSAGLAPGDDQAIVDEVKRIWAQVNVQFLPAAGFSTITDSPSSPPLPAPFLTAPLSYDDRIRLLDLAFNDADFEVYLVRGIIDGSNTTINGVTADRSACNGTSPPKQNFSVIRTHDATGTRLSNAQIAKVVAHELGHALGLRGTYRGRSLDVDGTNAYTLMYGKLPIGTTITPLQRDCISKVR